MVVMILQVYIKECRRRCRCEVAHFCWKAKTLLVRIYLMAKWLKLTLSKPQQDAQFISPTHDYRSPRSQ